MRMFAGTFARTRSHAFRRAGCPNRIVLNMEQLESRDLLSGGPLTQYLLPGNAATVLTKGPDGNVWFTELTSNIIGTIDSTGKVKEFTDATLLGSVGSITLGSDGN